MIPVPIIDDVEMSADGSVVVWIWRYFPSGGRTYETIDFAMADNDPTRLEPAE